MMTRRFGILRRFRFNLPQRIAAVLLLLFLAQGLWLASRQAWTERDEQHARCGSEMWRQLPFAGNFSHCGGVSDGILACRLAGLPLALHRLAERGREGFRAAPSEGPFSAGELFFARLPFLLAGCLLGGGLWWVTRRLYGNLGGYTALALYCFSPTILQACVALNPEVLAALGVYGGVYTCIGVAHAMQGPRRKWRPRIVLLTAAFGLAAAAHLAALLAAALLGLAFMLWVAEGHRRQVLPVLLAASAGALAIAFACYGFSPSAFSHFLGSSTGLPRLSLDPARRFFLAPGNAGITLAAAAAVALFLAVRRSRYFGNATPLICALALFLLAGPDADGALWALPFLLTFVAGLFADAYESRRGRLALVAAGAIVLPQALFCVLSLPGVR
jgi:hypothetical protein